MWLQTPTTSIAPARLQLGGACDERRPLLGPHAVAVKAGVDLEVHPRRRAGVGRGIRQRPRAARHRRRRYRGRAAMAASRLVARRGDPRRRCGRRGRARRAPAMPVRTSNAPNQRTPSAQAACTIRLEAVSVGVVLDDEHVLGGRDRSRAITARGWRRSASRSIVQLARSRRPPRGRAQPDGGDQLRSREAASHAPSRRATARPAPGRRRTRPRRRAAPRHRRCRRRTRPWRHARRWDAAPPRSPTETRPPSARTMPCA